MSNSGWIGVDLDGTLARIYWDWKKGIPFEIDKIGEPIPRMVERIKRWLAEGKDVRILTARVYHDTTLARIKEAGIARNAINEYTEKLFGKALPVTCMKDYHMVELWDDRAVQVRPNTGEPVDPQIRAAERIFD